MQITFKPTRATSTLVARDMAQKAYERALYLSSQEESILNCSPEQIGVKKLVVCLIMLIFLQVNFL